MFQDGVNSIHNVSEWTCFSFIPFSIRLGSCQKATGDSLANSRLRQRRSSETKTRRIGVGNGKNEWVIQRLLIALQRDSVI